MRRALIPHAVTSADLNFFVRFDLLGLTSARLLITGSRTPLPPLPQLREATL
jgi:hypothetical protein